MGLETGTYIDSLVATNPLGSDSRQQGDDHIRLIKSTIKNTFPNIDGAVNATPAELNLLQGQTSLVPEGSIVMFAGTIANIPTGWQLCNGTGTTTGGIAVPDLTGRFVVHADADSGGTYAPGATGGSDDASLGVTVDSHVLTIDEIPAHTHTIPRDAGKVTTSLSSGHYDNSDQGEKAGVTGSVGGGLGHTHGATVSGTTGTNRPPYYALAYMIKL